jgi:cell division protease FtsH
MPERTVVLLTGEALAWVTPACQLARSLEPAMVVLEDVDLIARDRSHFRATPFLSSSCSTRWTGWTRTPT